MAYHNGLLHIFLAMDFGRCPDQVQTCDELLMDEFEFGISYDLVARSRLDVRFWDESERTSQGQGQV